MCAIYTYIHTCRCMCIYIYIYIEREREIYTPLREAQPRHGVHGGRRAFRTREGKEALLRGRFL